MEFNWMVICLYYISNNNTNYYNNNDRTSFFNDIEGKPIRFIDSTRSGKNRIEETKLFQNTMTGKIIKCPSPFKLFHNKYFTITYKLPMICTTGDTIVKIILQNEDGTLNQEICRVELKENKYDIIEIEITPKNSAIIGNKVETEYYCKNNNILTLITLQEPITLYLQIKSETKDIVLSNYRTTIMDKSIKTGTEYQTYFIRSKNGVNTCDVDEDCFEGFMCLGHLCLKCHSSCLRCSVDISESNFH